ncbi:DUF72 domain-containing protein [Mucilaginibacter sp. JRF]|uniref:DUF72 domain-containing protein n=1 Tax=Mucilaginibacter sp. JRF TaxID=2780088 RepID=UPI00187FBF55|nr:DUF72 domain-containing protein [Mucilaginibacter sp. JRF]MBE9585976.1 DUF72 domain-containing protein [Mucilaginibacter sp. JRF]
MEFGHVDEALDRIDFTLPPDTERTKRTFGSKERPGELNIYIGASKWGEKSWKGRLYPKSLPDNQFLGVYSQNFNAVEFGPSFYTIYNPEQINKWAIQVAESPGFKFCPKFPQSITHLRRLANSEPQTAQFYQSLSGFGKHLGPLLLQLGDNFSPKSFPQLKTYLQSLDPAIKVAVEVRNKNWYYDSYHREELFHLLNDLDIGTVISDTAGRRDCVHMELTTTDAFIRFVGNNLADTDYKRMDDWIDRLKQWVDQGLTSIWFFIHQNDEKHVPQACEYFIKKLNQALQLSIKPPKLINEGYSPI